MKKTQNVKAIAVASMVVVLMVVAYYSFGYCGSPMYYATVVGSTILAPAIIFFMISYYWATVVACVVMIAPAVWVFRVDCVVYDSGAGMAILAIPFFGAPVAFILGAIVEYLLRKKNAG